MMKNRKRYALHAQLIERSATLSNIVEGISKHDLLMTCKNGERRLNMSKLMG